MYAFHAYISEHSDSEIISGSNIDGGLKNFWSPYVPQYKLNTRFEHLIPLTFGIQISVLLLFIHLHFYLPKGFRGL